MKGRKNIRLDNYDYKTDGYYFVTIVTKNRKNLLQDKKADIEGQLHDLKLQVKGLEIDYFVIMPDHVHFILILENCKLKLGEIVRRFKAKVSYELGTPVWQANYYEHVIRNEKALDKIREYIINNPQKELLEFEQFYESR